MSVEQTFLDAIRQEPDEMVHRLAFTDWLEDREDPRAELIRIHLELDEIPEYARHISDPIFRKRLWWREHAAHWLNTFPDVEPIHCWCERGVPEDAQFENFKTFQRIGAEWLACTAIHRVQFRTLTGCKMLARMRLLQQVTELMMDRPGLRSHALNVLFKSENINNLRRLSVTSSELDPSTARAIRDCPHLGNLRGLDLSHNAIKDEGVAYLAQFPGQLQSLALRRVGLTNQGIQALVDSTLVEGLEQLDLNFNDLGDEAVALLAECESLTNLTNLEISDCRLSAKGVKSLCESKHLSHLKRLDLSSNDIAEEGVSMIPEATFLPSLERIELGLLDDRIPDFHTWAGASFPELRYLDLGSVELSASTLSPLIQADMPKLRYLDVSGRLGGDESVRALADWPALASVEQLNLCESDLTEKGAEYLAQSQHLSTLKELDVWSNELGPEGIFSLVNADWADSLTHLDAWGNLIGDDGVKAIARSSKLTSLRSLDLSRNSITANGLRALLDHQPLGELRQLSLCWNPITDEGLDLLRASPFLSQLIDLELRRIEASSDAMLRFVESPHFGPHLKLWIDEWTWDDKVKHALRERRGDQVDYGYMDTEEW